MFVPRRRLRPWMTLFVPAVLLACVNVAEPDPNEAAQNTFPLNRAVWLDADNVGDLPVHIFDKDNESFDPSNRLAADTPLRRQLASRTFDAANSVQLYTIVAGRSGTVLDEKIVTMTGAEAKAGKNLSATWFDGNQTLVVTLK